MQFLTSEIVIITLILLGVPFCAFLWNHFQRSKRVGESYNELQRDLILQLEIATQNANLLALMVHEIKDEKILVYYESAVKLLENFLLMLTGLSQKNMDLITIQSARYLAASSCDRFKALAELFDLYLGGKKYDVAKLCAWPIELDASVRGCYFCSRPHLDGALRFIKIKLEKDYVKVASCPECMAQLADQKPVKILYFKKSGRLMHWSDLSTYQPLRDFWRVREFGAQFQKSSPAISDDEPGTLK